MSPQAGEVTKSLTAMQGCRREAADRLFALVYPELRHFEDVVSFSTEQTEQAPTNRDWRMAQAWLRRELDEQA